MSGRVRSGLVCVHLVEFELYSANFGPSLVKTLKLVEQASLS